MASNSFQEIAVSKITIPENRARSLNNAWAEVLAESISEQGLLSPITVRPVKGSYDLITGLHRLAATKLIGADTISAHIRKYGDKDADYIRLEEISENVIRNELNALDRARCLYELDAVYKKLYPERKQGGDRKKNNQTAIMAVWSELLDKVGISERVFFRSTAIWKGLSAASRKRIPGTWLADHQAQLIEFANLEKSDQAKVLDLLFADDNDLKSVGEACDHLAGKTKPSAADRTYRSAIGSLGRMTPTTRAYVFDTYRHEIVTHAKNQGWF